ncbi:beta-ketoacyl synthase N-terminal-like domain-containing protein [Stigmatella sp. ncwal1]|uniref:Beta-ketoacyl synthase N-terminal-like domain-containing protein n=2 Tax=Stigmatella ashevillensis TaxID=2995309 RepID=A0ABT5DC97_9BACT|nr:beta-ketoacyl synthase N-terminal-like domain-containing protein [Stigmatella ashevillena]
MGVAREPVAIIGMSGRFPGANTLEQFWENLRTGTESIQQIPQKIIDSRKDPRGNLPPHFVPRGSFLADTEWFDPQFFGLSLRDAKVMDPQQRLFIEYAWTAIEDAGYEPETLGERVAVYGGGGPSRHILDALDAFGHDYGTMFEVVATGVANAMAMRVSHLFNLLGESIYIYTACSTTLVAIDMACRAVLDGRADVALAGGTALWLPQMEGYEHVEGMILSKDGHCRAFDARASGTVWGNGVAALVLKPLAQALRDRDPIRAVISGSAVNNDGRQSKLSFASPSADGQARCIRAAYAESGISPQSVSFVEAHGTATVVGDPLELEGLHLAFGKGVGPKTVALGSVKTNIGHLDPVAGIASVMKTVLALENEAIPANLHFEHPNPAIDFNSGPFFVNTSLHPWPRAKGAPRRAGVNSFGVGGTNAHVILEEAPEAAPVVRSARPRQLITLSARTEKALEAMTAQLAAHLRQHPELDVADVAFTRALGRRQFDARRFLVADGVPSLLQALESPPPAVKVRPRAETQKAVFLFPGQGSQHPRMAQELYTAEPEFRRDVDDCCEALQGLLKRDVREVLFPGPEKLAWAEEQIQQTSLTQPLLFVVEYALARQWMRWGLQPAALMGHSVGEYVAACLAGVFNPGEALTLLAARGRCIQDAPTGAMIAITRPEAEVSPLLSEGLGIAAVNSPTQCVVSGPHAAIESLEKVLADKGIESFRLRTSHAFHSALLEGAAEKFLAAARRIKFRAPSLPFISNLTGTWITPEQATDPQYWAKHLRQPVRFWEGLQTLRSSGHRTFLEVGPGHTLSRILLDNPVEGGGQELALASLKHPKQVDSDYGVLLRSLGTLWAHRVSVKWAAYYGNEKRRRVRLPHYPFEKSWCALYEPGEEFKLVEKALGAQRLGASRSDAPRPAESPVPPALWALEHPPEAEGAGGPAARASLAGPPLQARPSSYSRDFVAPSGEVEVRIAEVFGRALGIREVGADDDLMELGGHSLMLVAITNHLRAMFDVQISTRAVMENPTPATLARKVESLLAEKHAAANK